MVLKWMRFILLHSDEKDYRHKTVCHTGEVGVLGFCLLSLGDAGKEAIQIKDRRGFLTEAILPN